MIVDLIMGLVNSGKAKKIDAKRPEYTIPQEVFQNQKMYEALASSSRVPGQSYIENQIGQNQANALSATQRAAGSSADALAAISGIQQNSNNMFNQLGMQGAEFQAANRDKLAQANETVADYRQQAFDYNKNQPYQIKMAQKQKYQDQAYQNWNNIGNDVHEFGMAMGSMGMGGSGGGGGGGGASRNAVNTKSSNNYMGSSGSGNFFYK